MMNISEYKKAILFSEILMNEIDIQCLTNYMHFMIYLL